jgi:hypothetical protein
MDTKGRHPTPSSRQTLQFSNYNARVDSERHSEQANPGKPKLTHENKTHAVKE